MLVLPLAAHLSFSSVCNPAKRKNVKRFTTFLCEKGCVLKQEASFSHVCKVSKSAMYQKSPPHTKITCGPLTYVYISCCPPLARLASAAHCHRECHGYHQASHGAWVQHHLLKSNKNHLWNSAHLCNSNRNPFSLKNQETSCSNWKDYIWKSHAWWLKPIPHWNARNIRIRICARGRVLVSGFGKIPVSNNKCVEFASPCGKFENEGSFCVKPWNGDHNLQIIKHPNRLTHRSGAESRDGKNIRTDVMVESLILYLFNIRRKFANNATMLALIL